MNNKKANSAISKDEVIKRLKTVKDPELGIDVYTLGLIYDIATTPDSVDVTMTLTSPLCPFGNEIVTAVEEALAGIAPTIRVEVTFDPPWEPSDELRAILGV